MKKQPARTLASKAQRPTHSSETLSRKRRGLTILQRRYIKHRKEGFCKYQAAIAAGYSHQVASSPTRIIERPRVRAALERWLVREGIDDGSLGIA